jgi:endoglucanase
VILFFYTQISRYNEQHTVFRVAWRGDSHTSDNGDGHPLDGGYYDAGDNIKFNWPMAYTSVMLAWSGIAYPEGYAKAGQQAYLEGVVRWAIDYFIKCHVSDHEYYAQVCHVYNFSKNLYRRHMNSVKTLLN